MSVRDTIAHQRGWGVHPNQKTIMMILFLKMPMIDKKLFKKDDNGE